MDNSILFEGYINGSMTPTELKDFEAKLRQDPSLVEELQLRLSIEKTLELMRLEKLEAMTKEVEEELKGFESPPVPTRKWLWSFLSLAAALAICVWMYTRAGETDKISERLPLDEQKLGAHTGNEATKRASEKAVKGQSDTKEKPTSNLAVTVLPNLSKKTNSAAPKVNDAIKTEGKRTETLDNKVVVPNQDSVVTTANAKRIKKARFTGDEWTLRSGYKSVYALRSQEPINHVLPRKNMNLLMKFKENALMEGERQDVIPGVTILCLSIMVQESLSAEDIKHMWTDSVAITNKVYPSPYDFQGWVAGLKDSIALISTDGMETVFSEYSLAAFNKSIKLLNSEIKLFKAEKKIESISQFRFSRMRRELELSNRLLSEAKNTLMKMNCPEATLGVESIADSCRVQRELVDKYSRRVFFLTDLGRE